MNGEKKELTYQRETESNKEEEIIIRKIGYRRKKHGEKKK